MSLVRLDDVSLAYGEQKLLVQVGFEIDPGERVCLIGRNGTGKTSLFRLITGIVQPDSGLIQYRSGLVMSTLDQALPENEAATVREVVAEGLAELKALVTEYEQLAHQNLGQRPQSSQRIIELMGDIPRQQTNCRYFFVLNNTRIELSACGDINIVVNDIC